MDTCTGDQPGHTSTKCQLLRSTLFCSSIESSGIWALGWASDQLLCVEREALLMGGGSAVVITHSGLHACQKTPAQASSHTHAWQLRAADSASACHVTCRHRDTCE